MLNSVHRTLGILVLTLAAALSVVHVVASEDSPNLSRALQAQQSLAVAHPSDANVFNDLGNLLVLASRFDDAETAYQRAIELRSDFVSARFNLGLMLQQQGRAQEARGAFEAVTDIDPEHAWSRYQLGVLLEARGDKRAAIEQYARALALDHRLAFAKNNPHVIENQLLTQALLRAREFSPPASAQAPRQYGDPERIAELMLGEERQAKDAMAPEAVASEETQEEQPARDVERAAGTGDTFFDDEDDEFEDDLDDDEAEGRVLSADDLDSGSRIGQAGSGATTRSDARTRRGPGSVLERYRRSSGTSASGRSRTSLPSTATQGRTAAGRGGSVPVERRTTTGGTSAAGRSTRFNPSLRSSGNLDLELRPASPATDPTAVAAVVTR